MEKLKVSYKFLEFWITQNGAECVDCIEGVLLDSLLYIDNQGKYTAFLDTFLTTNSSCYTMITGTQEEVFKIWDKLKEESETA